MLSDNLACVYTPEWDQFWDETACRAAIGGKTAKALLLLMSVTKTSGVELFRLLQREGVIRGNVVEFSGRRETC